MKTVPPAPSFPPCPLAEARFSRNAAWLGISLLLGGCAVGSYYEPPKVADIQSVLENQRSLYQLLHQLTDTETRTALHVVALYKALGWGNDAVREQAHEHTNG